MFEDFEKLLSLFSNQIISLKTFGMTCFISVIILLVTERKHYMQAIKDKYFPHKLIIKPCISFVSNLFLLKILGTDTALIVPFLSMLLAIYFQKKYFSFIEEKMKEEDDEDEAISEEASISVERVQNIAQKEIEEKFKSRVNFSILEVLFFYGYISNKQKETVEFDNIFEPPEEIAKKLLKLYAITDEQLREAYIIMNIIRTENRFPTPDEIVVKLSKMHEEHPDYFERPFLGEEEKAAAELKDKVEHQKQSLNKKSK